MKYLKGLSLFFLSLLFIHCRQNQNPKQYLNKYIIWKKYHSLAWANFKGQPPLINNHAARSYIWFDLDTKNLGNSIEVHFATYFIPDSSWNYPSKISDKVLDHETKHFNLGEISSRQCRKYLTEWKGRDYDDFLIYVRNGNFEQRSFEMQMQYDSETNHSLDSLVQKKWDDRIDSLLDEYENFSNPVFRITINKKVDY
jgi:hypothetical protein